MRLSVSFLLTTLATLTVPAAAQGQLTIPEVSPHARVQQTVGLTTIAVDYHRPSVNARVVWGGTLIPFGEVWRAGANENTVVEFSTPVAVEGIEIAAGRYGFHLIASDETATAIFSTMADAWGSYTYDPTEDALRVEVPLVSEASYNERLLFRFDDPSEDAATLVLAWETREVPIRISADTPTVVLASMERELRGRVGFFADGWNQIAGYAADHNRRLDEALVWADKSISLGPAFENRMTRARVLEALGRSAEADTQRVEAYAEARPDDLRSYARTLRRSGHNEQADAVLARIDSN